MAGEKERVDGYLGTVDRLEPDIAPIDASAFYASAAVSLKRIADNFEKMAQAMSSVSSSYMAAAARKGPRNG